MARTTTADGVELAYEVTGDGPPLVLVHGITENRHSWDPLVPALSETHRVIAMDLRGHGESGTSSTYDLASMAADLYAVLTAEKAADAILVGHSLGGTVVSAYASAFPTRAVVNVDQPLALAAFQAGLKQVEPMLRGDVANFEAVITMIFDGMAGALPEAERTRIGAIRRPVQDVVLGVWSVLLDATPEDVETVVSVAFGGIKAPYLSLHGIDPGPDYPAWLASIIPLSTCEVWAGMGHYPHLVDPSRFLTRLAAFENRLPS